MVSCHELQCVDVCSRVILQECVLKIEFRTFNMPRKRRRRSQSHLKPLVFVESPVNLNDLPRYPSPVFSSDNPATADVIPLNQNLTWVSPQFVNVPNTGQRRPRRHKCMRQNGMQSLTNLPMHQRRQRVEGKYKPLMFIDNKKQTGEFTSDSDDIEDCEYSCINECATNHIQLGKKKPDIENNRTESECGNQSQDTELNTCDQDVSHGSLTNFDVKTPEISVVHLKSPAKQNSFTNIKPRFLDEHNECGVWTRARQSKKDSGQRVVSNGDRSIRSTSLNCDSGSHSKRLLPNVFQVDYEFFPDSKVETPTRQFVEHIEILAYDTPEEDCGLSVRQRMLKEINR